MKIILGFICWFYLLLGYAADVLNVSVNKNNQKFTISLPANPTTGYQWTVSEYDKKVLHLVNSRYLSKKTGLMGSGGQMLFNFALNKGKTYPQQTHMVFKYARSWEQEGASVKQVNVSFTKK